MSKHLVVCMVIVALAGSAAMAAQTVHEVDWTAYSLGSHGFEVVPPTPPGSMKAARQLGYEPVSFACARVTNPVAEPRTVTVLVLDPPGITRPAYAFTGQVRCEMVGGDGYLEMWSFFPGGGQYFTRTLASQGPMARLHGTADWRPFVLPFQSKAGMYPSKLVINVVLPLGGSVKLGPLKLVEYAPGEDPLAQSGERRRQWVGGLIGGLLGSFLGLLGAVVGVLAGRGRNRRLVMGLLWAGLAVGLATLAVGLVAIVAWPSLSAMLLFAGGLTSLLFMVLRNVVRRRYDEAELRRMQAMDAP